VGIVDAAVIHHMPPSQRLSEHNLVLGWNWRACAILRELDQYVAPGSEVLIVASGEEDIAAQLEGLRPEIHNMDLTFKTGDTGDRRVLNELHLERFQHIILLSYCDTLGVQQADARTLITLLHLRDIADIYGHTFSIVSEMLDVRNRDLAAVTRADDFIVSDKLVSLMIAQVSENPHLNAVFADIFDPEGSEIYLKPLADYVDLEAPVNFYTLVEAARRRGEVAIGYRLAGQSKDAGKMYGVNLNPPKSAAVVFTPADQLIVLAES
jgi:hypothetical protein